MRRLGAAAVVAACALAMAGKAPASRHVLAWPPTRYQSAELCLWRRTPGGGPVTAHVVARGLDVVVVVPDVEAARVPLPAGARCAAGVDACGILVESVPESATLEVAIQSPDTAGAADTLLLTAHDTARIPPSSAAALSHVVISWPVAPPAEMPLGASFVTVVPAGVSARVQAVSSCAGSVDVVLAFPEALTLSCAAEGDDLTGLTIDADAPVVALSGSTVTQVPILRGASGDLLLDVAPDVVTGPTTLVVPPLPRGAGMEGRGDILRIVCLAPAGSVPVDVRVRDDRGGDVRRALAAGAAWDVDTAAAGGDRVLRVDADGPVAAWHLTKSRIARGIGDPAAIPVVPRARFTRQDRFFVPDGYGEAQALVMVAEPLAAPTLDGVPVAGLTADPGGDLEWAVVALATPPSVTGAMHELEGAQPFGAWIVGMGGYKAHGMVAACAWPEAAMPGETVLRGVSARALAVAGTSSTRTWTDDALEPLVFWEVSGVAEVVRVTRCGGRVCMRW